VSAEPLPLALATDALVVFVAGRPAPQGSKHARPIYRGRGDAREFTGKVAQVESSKNVGTWRDDVRTALLDEHGQPRCVLGDMPTGVRLEFVMPRPTSTPKRSTPAAIRKPDLDKLVRAVFDAITSSGCIADDARIVQLNASKRLAELGETAGCHIRIEALA
jgi:crossover junction endodeoxyribonuclease RusA